MKSLPAPPGQARPGGTGVFVTVDLLKAPFVPPRSAPPSAATPRENSPTPTDAKGGIAHPNIGAARNRTDSLARTAPSAPSASPSPAAHPAKRRQPASQRARFSKT
jgi:hypothetical protein